MTRRRGRKSSAAIAKWSRRRKRGEGREARVPEVCPGQGGAAALGLERGLRSRGYHGCHGRGESQGCSAQENMRYGALELLSEDPGGGASSQIVLSRTLFGPKGAFSGPLWALSAPFWSLSGPCWVSRFLFAPSWALLGPSWALFESFLGPLGPYLDPLGLYFGPLGPYLGPLGPY